MQKARYLWLFFACCLLSPIGSDGKIDSKKVPMPPFSNPVFTQTQPPFLTANPLDNVKMPRLLRKFIKKRFYTEGSQKKEPTKFDRILRRVFTILLIAVAVVLLVYWLQGTIGLALATLVIGSYWRNRQTIADWETRRKIERFNSPSAAELSKSDSNSLKSPVNKFTRRALRRFLGGVGLTFGALIFSFLVFSLGASISVGIFLFLLFLLGLGFIGLSVINAFQSIAAKEPQSYWSWLVIGLGIPLLLLFSGLVLAISAL